MAELEQALAYYEVNYDLIAQYQVRPGDKHTLGGKGQPCRFCGKAEPEVKFSHDAHAIPESLGNKSIFSWYECNTCNHLFGKVIEDDLGKWSKPMRTFARIKGKTGVPTLKKGGTNGWRIEYANDKFDITAYEDDPFFSIDEKAKTATFTLRREPFTPIAVLKAFMKIGLSLMPEKEIGNFARLRDWVSNTDHSEHILDSIPILHTFVPGPMPHDLVVALILRRKPGVSGVPYAFLVLAYGNDVYQIMLPSQFDRDLTSFALPWFPVPWLNQNSYGKQVRRKLDLTGRQLVRGETIDYTVGFSDLKLEP